MVKLKNFHGPALVLVCALLLVGCNTVVDYKDPYEGLLPPGQRLQPSPSQLRTDALKRSTLVMVTSANFENYVSIWQKHWEEGGAQQREDQLQGAAAVLSAFAPAFRATGIAQGLVGINSVDSTQKVRQSSDPRLVVERVYTVLRPYFREIRAASDFVEARNMKADYIAVVDYFGTFNAMGSRYQTRGGLYMLDGSLRKVFEAQGSADIPRPEGNPFAGAAEQHNILVRTYTQGLDITLSKVLSETITQLGAR